MPPQIILLQPDVNLMTLDDNRGGIFTYYPQTGDIKEWSYIVTHKGTDRGHHSHPEFDEYIMMISGHGCYIETVDETVKYVHLVGPGDCVFIPVNVSHTFKPMEDCRMMALLTKRWSDCKTPIKRENI